MSDRTQDLKNLRAVATRCKNYTDAEIAKSEEKMKWYMGEYSVSTSDDNTSASTKTVPANATRCKIKRIYGLTQKLNPTTASDSTSYSVKTMPATVYDFDISKVEGNSEKSENLLIISDVAETTTNGITYKIENGVITLNGTSTRSFGITLSSNLSIKNNSGLTLAFWSNNTPSQIYEIDCVSGSDNYYLQIKNNTNTTFGSQSKASDNKVINSMFLWITNGTTFTNYQLKLMIINGSTAPTEYKAGYTGIHNFAWTGVKVEGANLFDLTQTTSQFISVDTTNGNVTASGSGYADGYIHFYCQKNTDYYLKFSVVSYTVSYQILVQDMNGNNIKQLTYSGTFNSGDNTDLIIKFRSGSGGTVGTSVYGGVMIVYGTTTSLSYVPYITPTTTTIDLSSILYNGSPLFENGLCAKGSVKDSIEPYKATKKWTYRTEELNSTNLIYESGNTRFVLFLRSYDGALLKPNATGIINLPFTFNEWNLVDLSYFPFRNYQQGKDVVFFRDDSITTVEQFIAKYGSLFYGNLQLNDTIEVSIDWSSTLRGITGYSNGTISLLNTNNQDTANLITYNSTIKENCCAKMVQSRGGNVIKTVSFSTQASDGWSAGSVYNYRDYTTNKRETSVNKNSDLGGLSWTYSTINNKATFTYDLTNGKATTDNTINSNLLTRVYATTTPNANYSGASDRIISLAGVGSKVIWLKDSYYTDSTTLKTSLTNEPLYYELADTSKTSTDITPIENVLEVQPNDTLAFYDANDNLVTVQSDLTYRIEVES